MLRYMYIVWRVIYYISTNFCKSDRQQLISCPWQFGIFFLYVEMYGYYSEECRLKVAAV